MPRKRPVVLYLQKKMEEKIHEKERLCLCSVPEMSLKCHGWQVRESVEAVDFPVLSLMSRQIKPYLPQRITLLCAGILRRVSARGALCGAFPATPGKLPQLPPKPSVSGFGGKRTSGRARELFRFAEKRRMRRPRGRGASRAPGCPPSASPSPKGVFRAAARTHVGAKSAPFETPSGRGHFKLRFLAPPSPHKVF